MTVRTRFAPSPTGYLHIGGVRTALFSWLYAKKQDGEFILRIEDTDRERSTDESVRVILEGMDWLGLAADEGPFYQTHRMAHYEAAIQAFLDKGLAYRCTCSRERLDSLREAQIKAKEKPRYDGHCRDKNHEPTEASFVVRFKTPQTGEICVKDSVKGDVVFQNAELDDLIIARSDGTPTYNLTVVVDDAEMGVTHVIRGDDHLNNTPRQMHMLAALEAAIPQYAHVPLILGEDGKRLSKRHGAVNVLQFRDEGYLPEAVLNYLVRLGWSHGDMEVFSLEEMIAHFTLEAINASAAAVNPKKLLWLNQHYLKTLPVAQIAEQLAWHLERQGADLSLGPALEDLVVLMRERAKTLVEMAEKSLCFYKPLTAFDEAAAAKCLTAENLPILQHLHDGFAAMPEWTEEGVGAQVQATMAAFDVKMGKVAQPLRVAATGGTASPPINGTLHLLGQEKTLAHLNMALAQIKA